MGGDPRPVRGNGASLFDGTPVGGGGEAALEAEERHDNQAEINDEGGDPKPVRGNGTSLFEGTPDGGGVQAASAEEEEERQDAPKEPDDSGGQTAEDEKGLNCQEQHDVGGDQKLVRRFNVR